MPKTLWGHLAAMLGVATEYDVGRHGPRREGVDGSVMRVVLYRGEVCRLARHCRHLQVLSGQGWLTLDRHDICLGQGEGLALAMCGDTALVSPLSNTPLILEVRAKRRSRRPLLQAWRAALRLPQIVSERQEV